MEDGFDAGRLTASHDSLSMLRSAASERLRQALGAEGLAKASPLAARRRPPTRCSTRWSPARRPARPSPSSASSCATSSTPPAPSAPPPAPTAAVEAPSPPRRCRPAGRERRQGRARGEEQARDAGQAAGDAAPDAAHRHLGRLGARPGRAAPPDRRDRRGDHRRPEDPAQRHRAEVDRPPARRRHGRPRPARAAAPRRERHRHHGQRPVPGLRRAQGQGRADRRRLPRRPARAARRHPHRHRGRPPRRRVDAAGRRPPQGRQPRQHHHPAARHRRPDHLDPQVLQEGDHPRRDGAPGQHLARHGDGAEDRRPLPPQHPDLRRHRLGQDHAAQRHVAG